MVMYDFTWFGINVAFNALLLWVLAVNVSRLRLTLKIGHGDGGNVDMSQAIRAHANGVEHVIMFSLTLLALTFIGVAKGLLAGLVISFFVARLIHAYGMLWRQFQMRRVGASITFLAEAVAIVVLLVGVLTT